MSISVINKLLPAFKEKYLVQPVTKWGRQWAPAHNRKPVGKVQFEDFRNKSKLFKDLQLIDHFQAKPAYYPAYDSKRKSQVDAIWGSYGIALSLPEEQVRLICFDADEEKYVDLLNKELIPLLNNYEIDFIYEYSGERRDKAHLWIPTQTEVRFCSVFINQLRNDLAKDVKTFFDEIYPYGARERSLIRLPGGFHIKNQCVHPIRYGGRESNEAEFVLESFIEAGVLTQEKLLSLIKETPKERKTYAVPEQVIIQPRKLKVPLEDLPPFINKLSRECQAINQVLLDTKDHKLIEKRGGIHHNAGLYLSGLAQYNDYLLNEEEGRDWFNSVREAFRTRDDKEHNWDYYWDKKKDFNRIVPSCKKWEETFDYCSGCPFKGKINSPRVLFKAQTLRKNKVGDIQTRSLEWIRANIFPQISNEIQERLRESVGADILVDTIQNSGKSVWADELAVRLSNEGYKVCIACPSAQVAMEHRARILAGGGAPFVLFSFDNIFEHLAQGISCPKSQEISDCRALGIDSSYYKAKYCKKCPLYEECPFPRQYSIVQEDKYPIAIIQHAHLSCAETVRNLFKKQFDVLIVDESFVDQLTFQLIPSPEEVAVLAQFENRFPWLQNLLNWIRVGGHAEGDLRPAVSDLRPLLNEFRERGLPYRLDQFIRSYNDCDYYHIETGVMKFIPLPEVPIRVFTDATPSIEELEIILNNPNIIRFGGGIVLDPSVYHPMNKVYQILDGRASKSEMLKKEKLYEYLEFIGDKMMGEYKDYSALITVFKEAELDTFEWLLRNYPEIMGRIAVNHMAVGTNQFAHFNIQFILASPYISTKMMKDQVYKLKFIANYWRRVDDRPLINNPFPSQIETDAREAPTAYPVRRIHREGIFEYPQYQVYGPPKESYDYLVWLRLLGKSQQSLRVRHLQDKVTIAYFFNNSYLGGVLVDEVFTEQDLLAQYRK